MEKTIEAQSQTRNHAPFVILSRLDVAQYVVLLAILLIGMPLSSKAPTAASVVAVILAGLALLGIVSRIRARSRTVEAARAEYLQAKGFSDKIGQELDAISRP